MTTKVSNRSKIYNIIFTTNGRDARLFDQWLIIFIILSCFGAILESVPSINTEYGFLLKTIEWFFTLTFTIEYILRIYSAKNRFKYIKSAWGIIDLLAILPTYLMLIYPPITTFHYLINLRMLRLLRVFRVFKLSRYVSGGHIMIVALKSSRPKIIAFLLSVVLMAVVLGTLMHIIEGKSNDGFETIPDAIYWSIVTLTTVGYGDVVPITLIGKIIASLIMILGYGIIAVPTGIVSSEITKERINNKNK